MLYSLNPCDHIRGPGGSDIGSTEYKREPVSTNRWGSWCNALADYARGSWPSFPGIHGEGRTTVADKLGSAMSLAKRLTAVMIISLLAERDAMTTEEQATLATIGTAVEMRVRDLCDFLTAWTGGGAFLKPKIAPAPRFGPPSCCTYVAGTCGTGWNRTGRHGTRRDNDSESFRAVMR